MDINNRPAWIRFHIESQDTMFEPEGRQREFYIQQGYEDNIMGRARRTTDMTPLQARAYNLGWNRAERDLTPSK